MSPSQPSAFQWQAFKAGAMQAFHRYANWLVGITWKRFVLLSILLIVIAAITQSLPPFSYTVVEEVEEPIELPELPKLTRSEIFRGERREKGPGRPRTRPEEG
jgi:hypothetical protein